MRLAARAAALAEELVAPLGRRWLHVRAVAERAAALGPAIVDGDREVLVAAAWLHDIGYAPQIAQTQFHPLDGARYLRDRDWPEDVVNLVAHHSGARFEAAERGLTDELAEYPFIETALSDALSAADLTTGPGGERFTYEQRLAEILSRYPAEHPVHRTWLVAGPVLREVVARVVLVDQSATG